MKTPAADRSRADVVDLVDSVEGPTVVRIAVELDVDVDPLTAYTTLAEEPDSDHTFLLESAEKVASSDPDGAFEPNEAEPGADRHARFSFVGYDPDAVISVYPERTEVRRLGPAAEHVPPEPLGNPDDGDVLDRVRAAMPDVTRVGFPQSRRQTLDGGLVGFLAYDAVYDLRLSKVGVDRPDPVVPDAEFVLTTRTVIFDDLKDEIELVFTPIIDVHEDPGPVYDGLLDEAERVAGKLRNASPPDPSGFTKHNQRADPKEEYEAAVRRTKQHVLDGDIYQGVISRTRTVEGELDPLGLYDSLRETNPSPYMYLLQHGDRSIVGASPETLVSVTGRRIVSNPIAGTCPRGTSPVEDRRLAGEMLADDKERAEHTMLVDLARNDVRRVATPGSVEVEEFMNVLKYSHVQHIESTVTGRLNPEADAFDATRATFPAGTLTGAPKLRAMEIIDSLERSPRGVYGGGVGYFSWTGDADFAIVIRTATIEHGSVDRITVQAGAGIVADSDPASEYRETEQKMDGVLTALERITTESDAADGAGEADTTGVSGS